ncbi:MAG: four-carbon acid sugar kinase family protein [Halomonas sp.]|uniref:four-carbon acid sugar kinase family protein n=1 Tax=Halomonas sp. TaxID=1486246 RepID=UPI0028702917|nr:four-carbon acid sugar kinase family protein [Halomonas sp.]MDR9437986.1 four-carbon acid sugar kinase family protein [Halomonas sp.]
MTGCRLAIVADDLTGALDATAPFAARGADARVVISLAALDDVLASWDGAWPDVIAVNTQSRHLGAVEAAERVADATRRLARASPAAWFKKIDSTLRGQIVAECIAMREATGQPLLLAPAVPAQSRVVREAEVWVDGVRLAESAYQGDARSAPLRGPLDCAFNAGGVKLARYAGGDAALLQGDVVADADSDLALARLYDAALGAGIPRLMVGAAGLATAMAQRCFGTLRASHRSLSSVSAVLYVVGSRSPRAAEQLSRLRCELPSLPVIEALGPPCAIPQVDAALLVPRLMPGSGSSIALDDKEKVEAEEVAGAMAEGVAHVLEDWPHGRETLLFLTGGDIAMATLMRLGVTSISVEAEWAPGVALGCLDGEPTRRVMTKAGGFGAPDLLQRLHRTFH